MSRRTVERIPTGIPGLDEASGGGWIKGGFIVISGGTGTGKTTICMQTAWHAAVNLGYKVYVASFEEGAAMLRKYMKTYGWDLEELERRGSLVMEDYVGIREGVEDMMAYIVSRAKETGSSIMILDSLTTMMLYVEKPPSARSLLDVLRKSKPGDMTVIATANVFDTTRAKIGVEEIIADMLFYLDNIIEGKELKTRLLVVKARGSRHSRRFHEVVFTSRGVEVVPWQ